MLSKYKSVKSTLLFVTSKTDIRFHQVMFIRCTAGKIGGYEYC